MIEKTIEIGYDDVVQDVYAETGFMGKKRGDMETVAATGDDATVLRKYFKDAAQELAGVLVRTGSLASLTDTSAQFALAMPDNWRQEVQPALDRAMREFMYACMVRQWFNLSKDDKAAYYADLAARSASRINGFLYERSRPARS